MQITKYTHKIVTDSKGELRDVSFSVSEQDLYDDVVNTAIATRWLYRKQQILRSRLKREPTQEEILWEYKGVYGQAGDKVSPLKTKWRKYYETLANNR